MKSKPIYITYKWFISSQAWHRIGTLTRTFSLDLAGNRHWSETLDVNLSFMKASRLHTFSFVFGKSLLLCHYGKLHPICLSLRTSTTGRGGYASRNHGGGRSDCHASGRGDRISHCGGSQFGSLGSNPSTSQRDGNPWRPHGLRGVNRTGADSHWDPYDRTSRNNTMDGTNDGDWSFWLRGHLMLLFFFPHEATSDFCGW